MKSTALLLLYGNYSYDGRAKRMHKLLSAEFDCQVLSVAAAQGATQPEVYETAIWLAPGKGVVLRHLTFWKHAIKAVRRTKPVVVVAEDFHTTLIGYIAAIIGRARLVYDAHELIIPGDGERLSWRDWAWYRMERFVVKRCNLIIAANPERAALMQKHYGLARPPEYMRNIPDQGYPSALEIERVRAEYPALQKTSGDEKILIYQGYISEERGLRRFVEAMEYLPANWRLVIVGDGPDLPRLNEAAARLREQGRYHTLGRIPTDKLSPISAACDVGIVTYPFSGLNNIYCAPNKIYEYFLSGLPVIASGQPTIRAIVEALPYAVMFDEGATPQTLASQITECTSIASPPPEKITEIARSEMRFTEARIFSRVNNTTGI